MDYPIAKAQLVGRTLRENSLGLIPRDQMGRNKATHLSSASLVSLMVGFGVASPIASAPTLVAAYLAAGYSPPLPVGKTSKRKPILEGTTLGEALVGLVEALGRQNDQSQRLRSAYSDDFRVTLTVGEALVATVERPSLEIIDEYDAKGLLTPPEPRTFELGGLRRTVVPLRRIVHLDFVYFEVAADLWADSLAHSPRAAQ